MKLGLFGGTFNPIHSGHLTIADQVRQLLALDRIVFIPAALQPLKTTPLAPAADRLEMIRLAIAPHPWAEVSTVELDRPAPSYSVDTVEIFKKERPNDPLFFLLGSDAFGDFANWRHPEQLLSLADIIVIARPGRSFMSLRSLPYLKGADDATLTALDRGAVTQTALTLPGGPQLWLVHLEPCSISSTHIRAALRAGEPVEDLLPAAVCSYILRHRLFQ